MTTQGDGPGGSCSSCGRPGDDLDEVRRVYVTVDGGRVTGSETVAAPERWCPACRALYPHRPGDSEPRDGPGSAHPPPPAPSS